MSHGSFKSDPWATIRMHAGNSLATKEASVPMGKKAKAKGGRTQGASSAMQVDE